MAVQAQYPSNVLLLNRNGQDRKNSLGNDYSLHQQSGAFHDQSHHMFFNSNTTSNGVGSNNNSRKRGRETVNGGNMPINLFSLQQQSQTQTQPTLVNIAHLQNQQQHSNIVSTGLQLAFGEHHQQQVQHHQQQNLVHQSSSSSSLSSLLTDDFSVQLNQQRDEIDQFIKAQGDQLRRTLAERRQRHYHALLGIAEESVSKRLREKEAEMEKAVRKNSELEARVAQLRAEAQSWQAKAKSQEETAVNLQTQLQHAMMNGGGAQDIKRDNESVILGCAGGGGGGGEAEDAESAYIDPERVVPISVSSTATSLVGPSCKACRRRVASVVLLPCRHLCLCTECGTAVEACPLCLSYRSASVEVFLS
ncbi:BOI-related E3 ubiquitin-protein ligase 1-like [Papaver somniferum]|uniref:BOI-related E3 ubiquitin-protein ligase 1-like n=1 Tax=Papaver somniferum TaxID=3469 RepID=UPI000E6F479A|nr:BOI-related E3 ubiquitin-protein ligase 1-like [Papaver somniferum]